MLDQDNLYHEPPWPIFPEFNTPSRHLQSSATPETISLLFSYFSKTSIFSSIPVPLCQYRNGPGFLRILQLSKPDFNPLYSTPAWQLENVSTLDICMILQVMENCLCHTKLNWFKMLYCIWIKQIFDVIGLRIPQNCLFIYNFVKYLPLKLILILYRVCNIGSPVTKSLLLCL